MSRDITAQTLMDWTKKTRMPFQVTPFPPIVIPVSRRPLFKRLQSREGEKAVLAGSYKKVGMDECWQQTRDKMLGFHQTETKPDRGGACWGGNYKAEIREMSRTVRREPGWPLFT